MPFYLATKQQEGMEGERRDSKKDIAADMSACSMRHKRLFIFSTPISGYEGQCDIKRFNIKTCRIRQIAVRRKACCHRV